MTQPIALTTYQDQEVDLSEGDAQFLAHRVGNKLRVQRPLQGPGYGINPQQYVGVIALPSGRRLSISPKISAAHVLYMLAVAYSMDASFYEELEAFASFKEILEPVAAFFANLVEERIREGLYRAYVETEENLSVVRGRIDFPRDVAYNSVLRHRTYCRYADFTWDVPENQVIRFVCHGLSGWNFRRPGLRRRLMQLDVQLDEVSRPSFTSADVRSFAYHRLNEPYRRIHRLCSLFLDAGSLSEESGAASFRTFLLDMNQLFEAFVTQSLYDRLTTPWTVTPQQSLALGTQGEVPMRPDLVVRHHGQVTLVADCKYKQLASESEYKQHDFYQLLSYCTALGTSRGALIYPKHEVPVEDEIAIRNSDVVIRRLSVDLTGDTAMLRQECDRLAQDLQAWSGEAVHLVA